MTAPGPRTDSGTSAAGRPRSGSKTRAQPPLHRVVAGVVDGDSESGLPGGTLAHGYPVEIANVDGHGGVVHCDRDRMGGGLVPTVGGCRGDGVIRVCLDPRVPSCGPAITPVAVDGDGLIIHRELDLADASVVATVGGDRHSARHRRPSR